MVGLYGVARIGALSSKPRAVRCGPERPTVPALISVPGGFACAA